MHFLIFATHDQETALIFNNHKQLSQRPVGNCAWRGEPCRTSRAGLFVTRCLLWGDVEQQMAGAWKRAPEGRDPRGKSGIRTGMG